MGSCLAKELYVDNGEKVHINNALITLNGSDRMVVDEGFLMLLLLLLPVHT